MSGSQWNTSREALMTTVKEVIATRERQRKKSEEILGLMRRLRNDTEYMKYIRYKCKQAKENWLKKCATREKYRSTVAGMSRKMGGIGSEMWSLTGFIESKEGTITMEK